ncbi:DUF7669 domain-containing protein [Staphylothermus hellenicus]|uniref:DUF7669 domain-containing protein n=1 Tax=Staphylothermus hellenicus (strain DSM 12710 / JCM 10830 / BK20S6-10-b1 / P8) TaxID=591019 RepID=D7DC26_STAHD|nr:hypothetical protein [Staphylothermus hellenicus]ADI31723.1 hypothetical protein Shell_0598 [Staphylothermus hellenicus DSM 12710]
MANNLGNLSKKPNWMILKEAAEQLVKSGKKRFSRKELTKFAKTLDPTRPETSLDFEIDLVTVNSNSKDRYRDPDKLFLFRIARGRYTLYDPEIHGPLEKYLEEYRFIPTRKHLLAQIIEELKKIGYEAYENQYHRKPLAPDIIAKENNERIGVWVIDPAIDKPTQLKALAYALGSAILNKKFNSHIITMPIDLVSSIPPELKELLEKLKVKIVLLKEEKKYALIL